MIAPSCTSESTFSQHSTLRGLLLSDFNLANLSAYLTSSGDDPILTCDAAPYNQVTQTLLDSGLPCWQPQPEFLVVWTRPDAVLQSVRQQFEGLPVSEKILRQEVDDYCATIIGSSSLAKTIFVPTWTVPTFHLGEVMLDLSLQTGVARSVMEANVRLLANFDNTPNVVALNASKWMEISGASAFDERLWYGGKIPFANSVFKAAAQDIKAALRALRGQVRKVIILDLDDTIWGGIVGEVGWQNVILGGHDPFGEALIDFQRALKGLTRRGLLLAIVSKNEEAPAMEVIDKHPEMVLRRNDFAAWRINWKDKAENIVEITTELNLGLNSVVFIDDSAVERDRVRHALPEVLVPDWPLDKRCYARAILSLNCFQGARITDEDRRRADLYLRERQRLNLKGNCQSVDEWLHTLSLSVRVERLGAPNLMRATQLLNKTNQMNLRTRRLLEREFEAWTCEPSRSTWVFYVSDRFGESGLTGILSLEKDGEVAHIVDFVLSCRVMGRKIEETMLHVAIEWARSAKVKEVHANYSQTPKNRPCYDFLHKSGLTYQGKNVFIWDTAQAYPLNDAIRLVHGGTF